MTHQVRQADWFVCMKNGVFDERVLVANEGVEVSVHEAEYYAYEHTLRPTSRNWGGTQHLNCDHEFRGQGRIPLASPGQNEKTRALLRFPQGGGFLVFVDGDSGAVAGEVGPYDRRRTLSLAAGRYFVRARMSNALGRWF